jgi:hypothetical protein
MKTLFNIIITKKEGNTDVLFTFTDKEYLELKSKFNISGTNKNLSPYSNLCFFGDTLKEVLTYVELFIDDCNHNEWFGLLYKTKYDEKGIGDGNCYNIAIARNVDKITLIDILSGNSPSHELY